MRRFLAGLGLLGVVFIAVTVMSASTASNSVPVTRTAQFAQSVTANTLKPYECNALNLSVVLIANASGKTKGASASELILGGPGSQDIDGDAGDDCILSGGGVEDELDGNEGTDVCIGTATTKFTACETVVIQ